MKSEEKHMLRAPSQRERSQQERGFTPFMHDAQSLHVKEKGGDTIQRRDAFSGKYFL
jgi:hypothetical protein